MSTNSRWSSAGPVRYAGAAATAFVISAVALISFAGGFNVANGIIYDFTVRHYIASPDDSPQVLVVRIPPDQTLSSTKEWVHLLVTLEGLGARQVVFNFLPQNAERSFYELAARYGNVVFGRRLITDTTQSTGRAPEALPSAMARVDGLIFGVVDMANPSLGIHRSQKRVRRGVRQNIQLVETVAANVWFDRTGSNTEDYLVNFLAGRNRMPQVSLKRVLADGLIPELVKGRSVLVGFAYDRPMPGVKTPLTRQDESTSLLMFQAYALNTLITKKFIYALGTPSLVIMLILIGVMSLFFYQWLSIRLATWITVMLAMIYLVAGILLLWSFRIWIPFTEIVVAQAFLFFALLRRKAMMEEEELDRMLVQSTVRLRRGINVTSFYAVEEHWSQVINMVNQTLELTRLIFLERVPGDHRVREVKALNCSMDDILEQRRDHQRTPYSTAIVRRGPIRLDQEYLKKTTEREDQYLVPLVFGGEVLGFWAFGVDPEQVQNTSQFHSIVRDFGFQIAELLYHRQQWRIKRFSKMGNLSRYLSLEGGRASNFQQLNRAVAVMERRLTTLEDVFEGLGTATILYDLFGRVMQVNRSMEIILQDVGIPVYELTSLDLISKITNVDAKEGRRILRYVILERTPITLNASISGTSGQSYTLSIKALIDQRYRGEGQMREATPFEILGVLIELVDVTKMRNLYRIKEELVQRINTQFGDDLDSILEAAERMGAKELSRKGQIRTINYIKEKIEDATRVVNEAKKLLSIEVDGAAVERYPINYYEALRDAINNSENEAIARKIKIKTTILSEETKLVIASPDMFVPVLESIIKLMIHDAAEETEVRIISRDERNDQGKWIIIEFDNNGFGLPQEKLDEYLYGDEDSIMETYRNVREAIHTVRSWDSELTVSSELGEGIRAKLRLRAFA